MNSFDGPKMFRLRQNFQAAPPMDLAAAAAAEVAKLAGRIRAGQRIAVAAGSRGIHQIDVVLSAAARQLKQFGASPFILPAMGSHGGATPEGQTEVLAGYGITEASVGAPIRASMEVRSLGRTDEGGIEIFCSAEALSADGILLVNRVKPHTDFSGNVGSGLMKMAAIGLGKRAGAAACHAAGARLGLARVIRAVGRHILQSAPVLGGLAIVEDAFHRPAHLELIPRDTIESREPALLEMAKKLMPKLPFLDIDLLIVDQIGKNISGPGMDPNVIGRGVHGYSSWLAKPPENGMTIRRIFVRDLTPETHGNAIGIGMADFTTGRLVRAMNPAITYTNVLTSLTVLNAKIPIHFATDQECVQRALDSLALADVRQAKVVRIANTLDLALAEASEAFFADAQKRSDLCVLSAPAPFRFGADQNLPPLERCATA